jgi:hypothetical protein
MGRNIPSRPLDAMVIFLPRGLGKVSDCTAYLEKGEEIYMSYGPHPNDFLLIECKLSNLLAPLSLLTETRWILFG